MFVGVSTDSSFFGGVMNIIYVVGEGPDSCLNWPGISLNYHPYFKKTFQGYFILQLIGMLKLSRGG